MAACTDGQQVSTPLEPEFSGLTASITENQDIVLNMKPPLCLFVCLAAIGALPTGAKAQRRPEVHFPPATLSDPAFSLDPRLNRVLVHAPNPVAEARHPDGVTLRPSTSQAGKLPRPLRYALIGAGAGSVGGLAYYYGTIGSKPENYSEYGPGYGSYAVLGALLGALVGAVVGSA